MRRFVRFAAPARPFSAGGKNLRPVTQERDARFATLGDGDVSFFESVLGPKGLLRDEERLEAYNGDWLKQFQGRSQLVLRPRTTDEVSAVLRYCNERRLAVVPQGGNTGLVGGSVPIHDELILSLDRMNDILSFDPTSSVVETEAGVILANLESYLFERDHALPLDLGAKGTCHIGGNIATNAGGIRLIRYGSLHGSVLGLRVVLADGQVLDTTRAIRKDNTGYDLKQLFIGSEGTLGVITGASILVPARPKSTQVVFLGLPSFDAVQALLREAKSSLAEILSAFEFLDRTAVETVVANQDHVSDPFAQPHAFYALIETSGSVEEHDRDKLERFLDRVMADGMVADGTMAESEAHQSALWSIRELMNESMNKRGALYKYDISLPSASFYGIVDEMRERVGERGTVVGFGHVGDGNLHLNVMADEFTPETLACIEPRLYEYTRDANGSVSAEHGIGHLKRKWLPYSQSEAAIGVMRGIKQTLDPHGILNPYKIV